MYTLKLMNGDKFIITDSEFKQIVNATGLIFIKSCNSIINTATIANINDANNNNSIKDRDKQQTGILHDGSRAKKHFGQYVPDLPEVPDDNGQYHPVKFDLQEYPEIALDIIATEEEWAEIKKTGKDYYKFLGTDKNIKRLDSKKDFTHLLDGKKKDKPKDKPKNK